MIYVKQAITRGLRPMFGKGYFYKHQVDFSGSSRCLRRPGFDSYLALIIRFIGPGYYQASICSNLQGFHDSLHYIG